MFAAVFCCFMMEGSTSSRGGGRSWRGRRGRGCWWRGRGRSGAAPVSRGKKSSQVDVGGGNEIGQYRCWYSRDCEGFWWNIFYVCMYYNIDIILASTCGNSTACVCYLNKKPVDPPPPPPPPTDRWTCGKGSYKHYKHLEAVAMLLISCLA